MPADAVPAPRRSGLTMRIGIGALVGIVGRAGHLRARAGGGARAARADTTTSCSPIGPALFAGVDVERVHVPLPTTYHQVTWDHARLPGLARRARRRALSRHEERAALAAPRARRGHRARPRGLRAARRRSRGRSGCTSALARAAERRACGARDRRLGARARGPGRALRPRPGARPGRARWRCRAAFGAAAAAGGDRGAARASRARRRGSSPASARSSRASTSSG